MIVPTGRIFYLQVTYLYLINFNFVHNFRVIPEFKTVQSYSFTYTLIPMGYDFSYLCCQNNIYLCKR